MIRSLSQLPGHSVSVGRYVGSDDRSNVGQSINKHAFIEPI